MPEQPFQFKPKTVEDAFVQIQRFLDDLYQETIAGAQIGDVFTIDSSSDVLTLMLSAAGGLQKVSGELSILPNPAGPMALSDAGLDVGLVSTTMKGAAPELPNDATKFLDGTGAWTVPGGAQMDPLVGYHISDMDDSGDPQYFGFEDEAGDWYILQYESATGALRYVAGSGAGTYAGNWTGRVGLSYDLFENVF